VNRSTGSPGCNAASFRVGDWVVEPARDLLVRGDEQTKIEPRTMEVLRRLARQPGAVVSQAELEADVWAGVIVTSQSVYQAIAQLRHVLRDNPRTPKYIETVPRRGYRLAAPVSPLEPEPAVTIDVATPALVPPVPATVPVVHARVRQHRVAYAALVGALAMLVVAGWHYWPKWQSRRGSSIAVLAFDDLSSDRSQAYLANVLVEELSSALGQVRDLRVVARDSIRVAERDGDDAAAMGRRLGVDHVLRGSVRRVGDRIRVVAVLVETETGYEKWSRTFERPATSMARLPADIAGAAAGGVGLALVGDPGIRGSRVGTRNPTAYDYYMLGQQRYAERTPFALGEAQRYYQQAIDADPAFAAAYAALADVHVAEFYFANRQLTETLDLVRIDLAKAIELAPNDAKAHMWLGIALLADSRPRDSLAELDRALELDPLNAILHVRRALTLDALGRNQVAIEAATRAVTLAPRHPNPQWALALIATSRGDLEQAIAHYEAALALDPARSDLRVQLATLLLDAGKTLAARRQLAEAARLAQSSHAFLTAQAYSALLAGNPTELASIAESLASVEPRNRYLTMDAANLMALAGETRKAIGLYDRVLAENADSVLNDLWMIRWGLETAPSCLAWSYSATQRLDERKRLIARVGRFLNEAEQRGVRYWGIPYQRAALAALQGDTANAMAQLEYAAAAGWRRTWWARTDPALASLRSLPEFELLLDRLRGSAPVSTTGTRD